LYTSILVNFQYVSIFTIVASTLLMVLFTLRLLSMDILNAFPGGVVRVPQSSHRINMQPKSLDVTITQILKSTAEECIKLKLRTNTSNLVTLRAYWGVDIHTFFHVLRSPWHWFKNAFDNGNLFGADACSILDPMIKIDVVEEETIELKVHRSIDLGSTCPRTKYPLVLVANASEFSFNINVIHIEDKSFMSFPTHILGQYLKLTDSSFHLLPTYLGNESSECVVCLSKPATRLTLPCRHASTCGQCFVNLPQGKCPMCRCQIQSYFLINAEEPIEEIQDDDLVTVQPPPLTWRQRLAELEHRFAMAIGLQENN